MAWGAADSSERPLCPACQGVSTLVVRGDDDCRRPVGAAGRAVAGTRRRPRRARRPLPATPPGQAQGGREAPGLRLPLHLLLLPAGTAAPLAPGVRRRARRG